MLSNSQCLWLKWLLWCRFSITSILWILSSVRQNRFLSTTDWEFVSWLYVNLKCNCARHIPMFACCLTHVYDTSGHQVVMNCLRCCAQMLNLVLPSFVVLSSRWHEEIHIWDGWSNSTIHQWLHQQWEALQAENGPIGDFWPKDGGRIHWSHAKAGEGEERRYHQFQWVKQSFWLAISIEPHQRHLYYSSLSLGDHFCDLQSWIPEDVF